MCSAFATGFDDSNFVKQNAPMSTNCTANAASEKRNGQACGKRCRGHFEMQAGGDGIFPSAFRIGRLDTAFRHFVEAIPNSTVMEIFTDEVDIITVVEMHVVEHGVVHGPGGRLPVSPNIFYRRKSQVHGKLESGTDVVSDFIWIQINTALDVNRKRGSRSHDVAPGYYPVRQDLFGGVLLRWSKRLVE